jgi:hypothetical protein
MANLQQFWQFVHCHCITVQVYDQTLELRTYLAHPLGIQMWHAQSF